LGGDGGGDFSNISLLDGDDSRQRHQADKPTLGEFDRAEQELSRRLQREQQQQMKKAKKDGKVAAAGVQKPSGEKRK
jgi:hypothetical protein